MAKLIYNKSYKANIIMRIFEILFGYHPHIFYKDNRDLSSKSWIINQNIIILYDLKRAKSESNRITRATNIIS